LAVKLKDQGAAEWYRKQARLIEAKLMLFVDNKNKFIKSTIDRVGGVDYKDSNLDIAVILALLHGDRHDGFFAWDDPIVLSTMNKLIAVFKEIYTINYLKDAPGIAIGRYPEDRYSGVEKIQGNPWVLATYAIAEASFRIANRYNETGRATLAKEMIQFGEQEV